MRTLSQILFCGLLISCRAGDARAQSFDHSAWSRVLQKFVTEAGRVDYAALRADPAELDRYVTQLAERSPAARPAGFPTRQDQMAYWLNAYNALVVKGVIENWPVTSVLKIGTLPHSFFWGKTFRVGGQEITLDHIEKEMLRKQFADPRIHFALVCASNSCPPLRRDAYVPAELDRQLNEAARAFINSPRGMRIDAAQHRVALSHIFKWYRDDFETYARSKNLAGAGPPVMNFIRAFASEANLRALDSLPDAHIDYLDYDWGINAISSPVKTTLDEGRF